MKLLHYLPFTAVAAVDVSNINASACKLHGSVGEIIPSLCGNRTCREQVLDSFKQSQTESEYNDSVENYHQFCEEAGFSWEDENMRFVDTLTQSSSIKASMANLMEFGCWCNMASGFKKGRGKPVNALDAVCRNVNLNTQCLFIDGWREDDYHCDPYEIEYLPALHRMSTDAAELETQCQRFNGLIYDEDSNPAAKACAVRTCIVSTYLVAALVEFSVTAGYSFEEEYIHLGREYKARDADGKMIVKEGTFNYKKECEAGEIDDSPKRCCGLYPYRHYYQSDVKECCVSAEGEYGREVFSIKRCGQCDPRGAHYESADCTVMI